MLGTRFTRRTLECEQNRCTSEPSAEVASAASYGLMVHSYFAGATLSTITRSSSPLFAAGTLSTTPLLF